MRAIVKVKQSQGRASSNAARYIAGSKLDPEREGEQSRPLFSSEGHDSLTYRKANRFLTGGRGDPIKNDLIHFSVSFLNEDFEALGAGDEDRKERLREAAREAMDGFKSDLRVSGWRWVAGIHLNTSHPHLHFLAFKEVTSDRGKPHRLGRIPKRLLPFRQPGPDGTTHPIEGKLVERFVAALDRTRQHAREAAPEREGQSMAQILLSKTLEFDAPLIHQGIEYRTVENFYQAMKTPQGDLETRRKIAAASPDEARALGEQVAARPDWPEIRLQVLETALRHKFAPGTSWHARLRATGDQDLIDGGRENHLGNILMRLRESREKIITPDEILLEANRRNPSLAGRELVQELILRGSAREPGEPPPALDDIREALKDRPVDDPYYYSQPERAGWLGGHSRELRDLYERGATIKADVLVIPAEEHELNNLTTDRAPFINELRYALREIRDPEKAHEFYDLARAIAGKTADTRTEIDYFRYCYDLIKDDGEGRDLNERPKEAQEEALDRALGEMRGLAGEMAKLETIESIEARKGGSIVSLEQAREADIAATHENEDRGYPLEPRELEAEDESAGLVQNAETEAEYEYEIEIGAPTFNTAARKVNLNDERLRFPAGLTFEERRALIEIHLPQIDAKLESGRPRPAIFGDINEMVRDWNREPQEEMMAQQKEADKNERVGSFLKAYASERLRDPETRALNRTETFRKAHEQITEARTPAELNRAAAAILRERDLGWRERALLFFGRAPAHHPAEMRELRHSFGLTRGERAAYAKAIGEGRRVPSPALERMLAELEARMSVRAISHYRASILNQEMRNPGRVDLHGTYERLPGYERDYLFGKIEERREALAGRHPSLRESAPKLDDASRSPSIQTPRIGGALREYTAAVAEIEQRLAQETVEQKRHEAQDGNEMTQADGLLTREDRLRIRSIASGLAWERLEPERILTSDPAVMELLSLSEAIAQIRDETQPRAREAARQVDEFIRSRGLDRFAAKSPENYYRAEEIPGSAMESLAPADRRALAALTAQSSAVLGELKAGFSRLDRIMSEIDQARAGKEDPDTRNGASGAIKYKPAQPTERDAGLDRERGNDRRILGHLLITHAVADCALLDYEIARDYGRTFRFNIHDESRAAKRRMSELDVNRRAEARGNRAADEHGAERKEDRLAISRQVSGADLDRHSGTLAEHSGKLDKLTAELESKAKDALKVYERARRLAGEVIEKYRNREEPPPAPLVEREVLVKAQDEAIKHRLADHAEKFERLRVALAEEHGQPARSEREAARLAAQVFTTNTEARVREERAKGFDETRHLRQWEIEDKKFSLAEIDRRVERLTDGAAIFGRYELHLDPDERRTASEEIERLGQIRQEVVEKIGERQNELREQASEAGRLLDTLAHAYRRESKLREQAGHSMPAPQFIREELERAADNIETLRDASLLRHLSLFERQFNGYADPRERFGPAEGWGRAPARALLSEIFHRENTERLTAFERRGEMQPLLIETPDGRLLTHRIKEAKPKSLIEQIARPLVETGAQRELRHGIEQAFARYEGRLRADFERTSAYLETAKEISSAQAAERTLHAGHELPAPDPALTPKQVMAIEIHAERQTDSTERQNLLSLTRGGVQSHFEAHSQTHSPEPPATREAAPGIGRGR